MCAAFPWSLFAVCECLCAVRRLPWLVARASARFVVGCMVITYLGVSITSSCLQKWSKGKVREKLQNMVMFDEKTFERLKAEVPKVFQSLCTIDVECKIR